MSAGSTAVKSAMNHGGLNSNVSFFNLWLCMTSEFRSVFFAGQLEREKGLKMEQWY
jgi:hypothetical protein